MVMGRPKKYRNCLDLDMDAEIYFESCIYEDEGEYIERKDPIPLTITGLAIAWNMDRVSILNYEKDQDFFSTIKRHKRTVENFIEQRLYGNNVAGLIFNLKNNFGWKDKTEVKYGMDKETRDHSTRLAEARNRRQKNDK